MKTFHTLLNYISEAAEPPVEHKGHHIRRGMERVDKKDSKSGHEWTEHKPLQHFVVNPMHGTKTTGPAAFSGKIFKTVAHAKKGIDDAISFENTLRKVNNLPDDHSY